MNRKSHIIFLMFLFTTAALNAQVSRLQESYHEKADDPYVPNAHQNKKVSPAYQYKNTPAITNTTSSIVFTQQVNVDANGQNIIDDAANEPSIAINPLNRREIVIGWRQFDNISSNFRQAGWSFSSDSGQTWTFSGVIEPGVFRSDPVLDFDNNGNIFYNSLTNTPSFMTSVFKSTDGGATWNSGVSAQGGDKQWMTVDRSSGSGADNIYSFWSSAYSVCNPDHFTRSVNSAVSFENCTAVDGDPFWGTMTVNSDGDLLITGLSNLLGEIICVQSSNAQTAGSSIAWNSPSIVDLDGYLVAGANVNPGGLLGQVNIDVDRSGGAANGYIYILSPVQRTSTGDPADIMFARSTDGGINFDAPVQINDDSSFASQWMGTMSVAPNGRIDIVWLDTKEDVTFTDSSALYYSFSIDQGITWSADEKISPLFDPHVGYPNQNKMGDYFHMISDNTSAHLAWANTLNGEQDVYYSRITPQITSINNYLPLTVNIYPNPSGDYIHLSTDEKLDNIYITNTPGQKMNDIQITENTIDIRNLLSGMYFITITNIKGEKATKKFIKR